MYALEDFCAFAGLYCAVRMVLLLNACEGRSWARFALVPAFGMCAAGVLLPLAVIPLCPAFAPAYGALVSWYKLLSAQFLLGCSLNGALNGRPHTRWLLAGTAEYALCLFYGILWIGNFEPVFTAWPDEYGMLLLVLFFAVLLSRRTRAAVEENRRLTERLQQEVEEKT